MVLEVKRLTPTSLSKEILRKKRQMFEGDDYKQKCLSNVSVLTPDMFYEIPLQCKAKNFVPHSSIDLCGL